MSDIAVTYKSNTIAQLSASGTKTLLTAGKFCTDDITINYTRPSVDPADTLVVRIYEFSGDYTLDKTYSQLLAAVQNGKTLIPQFNYPPEDEMGAIRYDVGDNTFKYYVVSIWVANGTITYYGYTLDSTNTETRDFKTVFYDTSE